MSKVVLSKNKLTKQDKAFLASKETTAKSIKKDLSVIGLTEKQIKKVECDLL